MNIRELASIVSDYHAELLRSGIKDPLASELTKSFQEFKLNENKSGHDYDRTAAALNMATVFRDAMMKVST